MGYDPELGRFISADTLVPEPGSSKAYDRYSYVNNNPINNNDPSGHWVDTVLDIAFIAYDIHDIQANGLTWGSGLSLAADVAGAIIPVATGLGVGVRAAFKTANAVDNAADIARTINAADNLVDTGKTVDTLVDAGHSADNLMIVSKLPTEKHHFSTNKNKTYTPKFDEIVNKYGLDLNGTWNIGDLPHHGRHPNDYHNFVLGEMRRIDTEISLTVPGNADLFIKLYTERVVDIVKAQPAMVRKAYYLAK